MLEWLGISGGFGPSTVVRVTRFEVKLRAPPTQVHETGMPADSLRSRARGGPADGRFQKGNRGNPVIAGGLNFPDNLLFTGRPSNAATANPLTCAKRAIPAANRPTRLSMDRSAEFRAGPRRRHRFP